MKTRKNKQKQKRKQKGGNGKLDELFSHFSFQLKTPSNVIKTNVNTWMEEEKKKFNDDYTLTLFEGKKELCEIIFSPYGEKNKYATIELLKCKSKTSRFQPISFIIMSFLLYILDKMGIEYVSFTTIAGGNDYYKLYQLYHSMGFVCSNASYKNYDIKTYENQLQANIEYLEPLFESFKQNEKLKKNSENNLFKRCGGMYGHIPSVLGILQEQIENSLA